MNTYLFISVILTISVLIYLYQVQEETLASAEHFSSVNDVLQNTPDISTQSTCDPSKGGVCYIDGMPKKIVDTVIANIQEDDHYKAVFKRIRSYTPENIYRCVGEINPMMSVRPLGSGQ